MNFSFMLFLISGCLLVQTTQAARILAIFAFPGKSHFQMNKALVTELLHRGHEVTFITNFKIEEKLPNYTEILIDPIYDLWQDVKHFFKTDDIFQLSEMTVRHYIEMLDLIGTATTEYALKHPRVQQLIRDNTKQFDLLLAEQFYQEAFLALALKYNVPVVTSSTLGFQNHMSQMMGVLTPWSFVPHGFLDYDDKMSFVERFINTAYSIYEDYYREIVYFPKQDAFVKKYLSHIPGPIPTVSQMEKNISLMLLNSHIPLTSMRPNVMSMVPVAGLHIKEPKPLPDDMKKFLDESKDGVIYFSLGTNLNSSDIPPQKLEILFTVFRSLKQRILWKWEDENISKLPKNVMVKKWMPQSDILAHPNVKVFITHGGLFGTQEGVYRAVPMLGIPVYCDQHLNMKKAEKAGYAISLDFPNITVESLSWSLNELIYNPIYKNKIQKVSEIFRDRPMSALETAMYWIEYVIRHKGAPQIRSAGLDLPWYSFYLLDIIFVFIIIAITPFLVIYLIVKMFTKRSKPEKLKKK